MWTRLLRPSGSEDGVPDSVLALTAIILLLRPLDVWWVAPFVLAVACLSLVLRPVRRAPITWILLALFVATRIVVVWPLSDNHIYLLAYWCLAIAALHIEIAEGPDWAEQAKAWRELSESALRLVAGERSAACRFVTSRPEDACFGVAHWVEFSVEEAMRTALADRRKNAAIVVDFRANLHQSVPLTETVRQSLLDDLALSERNAAA